MIPICVRYERLSVTKHTQELIIGTGVVVAIRTARILPSDSTVHQRRRLFGVERVQLAGLIGRVQL